MLNGIKEINIFGFGKKYHILLYFRIEEKEYILYKEEGNPVINVGWIEKRGGQSSINPTISTVEKEQIQTIIHATNQSIKTPFMIDCGYTYFKGQAVKVTFNASTWKREFYYFDKTPIQGSELEELNHMWNRDSDVLYVGSYLSGEHKDKKPILQRMLIQIGTYAMIVFLSTSLLTSSIDVAAIEWNQVDYMEVFQSKDSHQEEHPATVVDPLGNTRATIDIVLAINLKDSISIEEKSVFTSFYPLYNDNSEYFDLSFIIPRIESLKIEYKKNKNSNRLGSYNKSKNLITVYENEKFIYDNNLLTGVLGHEFLHAITDRKNGGSVAFQEGCTEMITKEYMHQFSNDTYQNQQTCVRMLCEIVGEAKVRESFSKGDDTILLEALSGNDAALMKDAVRLFKEMDDQLTSERSMAQQMLKGEEETSPKIKEIRTIDKQAKTNIIRLMAKFYAIHKEEYAFTNKLMCAYFDDLNDNTNYADSNCYIIGDTVRICVNKAYFNPSLIEQNRHANVIYFYDKTMVPTKDDNIQYYDEDIIYEYGSIKRIGTR